METAVGSDARSGSDEDEGVVRQDVVVPDLEGAVGAQAPDDLVIVRGQTRLIDGSRVDVRTATGEKPTSVAAGGDGE